MKLIEKQKKCPYCSEYPVPFSDDGFYSVRIFPSGAVSVVHQAKDSSCTRDGVVKFCPMCGRKLIGGNPE